MIMIVKTPGSQMGSPAACGKRNALQVDFFFQCTSCRTDGCSNSNPTAEKARRPSADVQQDGLVCILGIVAVVWKTAEASLPGGVATWRTTWASYFVEAL